MRQSDQRRVVKSGPQRILSAVPLIPWADQPLVLILQMPYLIVPPTRISSTDLIKNPKKSAPKDCLEDEVSGEK